MKQYAPVMSKWLFVVFLSAIIFAGCKKDGLSSHYEELRKKLPGNLKAFVNPFNDGSTIGSAVHLGLDIVVLFNEPGTKYAWLQDKRIQGVFSIKDPSGPMGAAVLDNIGAVFERASASPYLRLFAKDGKTYQVFSYDERLFLNTPNIMPTGNIGTFIDVNGDNKLDQHDLLSIESPLNILGGGPFQSEGFGAAAGYVKLYQNHEVFHVFAKDGTHYARWDNNNSTWGPSLPFTAWGGNNNLFTAVGAAARIILNDNFHNLFISKDGSQMGIWHLEGDQSVFEGPWTIH